MLTRLLGAGSWRHLKMVTIGLRYVIRDEGKQPDLGGKYLKC